MTSCASRSLSSSHKIFLPGTTQLFFQGLSTNHSNIPGEMMKKQAKSAIHEDVPPMPWAIKNWE
jgi:hypothetical protein